MRRRLLYLLAALGALALIASGALFYLVQTDEVWESRAIAAPHMVRGYLRGLRPEPVLPTPPPASESERERLLVRPGLTGWAQIQGRTTLSWPERIEFDRWYVANRSLRLDLRILLATDPEALTLVLGVVYRTISHHLLHKAGFTRATGATGAVTLVQRFGSALNLNVHFHMLFVDGVYLADGTDPPVFRHVAAPGLNELQALVEQIASRIGRVLERRGLVERDIENAWLASDAEAGPLDDLLGHSITYRIAVGPRAGQKLFTLQLLPARPPEQQDDPNGAARVGGFSLHAGVDIAPHQRPKLERLCRYVSRPPVATDRMALTASGHVRYTLKTPYRDGTTHIVLEPLDFMARLAALVPPPRMHLTRYHGVFAPHSKLRAAVTPARRGVGASKPAADPAKPPTPRHVAMNWARRLKRVFGIEIEGCARCGGKLKVIASIEEPEVIAKILAHLERTAPAQYQAELPLGARAPPGQARLI